MTEPKERWSHSIGRGRNRVNVFEHGQRKDVLYLKWPNPGTGKPEHESLRRVLRTKTGRVIKEVEQWARARAQEKYEQLVAGVTLAEGARKTPKVALTLVAGLKRATHEQTGKYPTDSKYRRTLIREVEFAVGVWTAALIPDTEEPWGPGRTWNSIGRADYRMLGRARVDKLLAEKETGFRQAEFCMQVTIAVANWLVQEELVGAGATPPKAKAWKEELTKYWIERSGSNEAAKASRPRYSLAELRAIIKESANVDPRLHLMVQLGVEQRLGQVHKCMRTQLTLPVAMDPKAPREVQFAELVIPSRGKKRTPVLELTQGQLQVVVAAFGESGYLRELEAAYQRGEIRDYPLFPSGPLPGARAHLFREQKNGAMRSPRGPSIPTAMVDRHANVKAIGMRAVSKWWREAETLAEVPYVEGRGAYGGRRTGVDEAKRRKISREGLQAHGGWSDTQVPDTIYAEEENRVGRAEARVVRASIRGENAE